MERGSSERVSGGVPLLWTIVILLASGELTWWLLHRFLIR
jgi:hypothetical protein